MTDFIHLHCHSHFSFHAGVASVEAMVSRAKDLRMPALALTDTDRMSGLILFYEACQKSGIRPILGAELTEPGRPHDHVVMLAKNADGYGDLCEILTKRQTEPDRFSYRQIFSRPWPNLFLTTPFSHLLEQLAATPNRPRLYGELINQSKETRERSRVLEQTALQLNVPMIVSNSTFFLDRGDWETHRILAAIGLNSTLSRLRPEEVAPTGAWLKPASKMAEAFPNHAEALRNTMLLADACQVELDLGTWILPQITVPEGTTPDGYLGSVAREGLEANYGGTTNYRQAQLIQEMELEVVAKLGYASYFLFVKEVRDWANERFSGGYRRPKDCTILRGSAANSITFYNIGVSDLDPIRYQLYFQRFLNEDRATPPDADLDFGWDERDEAYQHMVDRWGQDRVAVTCTTNHFRGRAAFRETAKVFGYSEEQVSEIMKSRRTRTKRIEDSEIERLMELAETIRGKPRFLGQHPGGLLITNDPIWRHVACEYSGGEKNRLITQIDMHNGIDELGLLKFDLLGNGSLSVLRDTLAQLKEQGLPNPEVWDLEKCTEDAKVLDIIRKGRTKGIFYIESPAQTRLNKKAQVESFEELAITSSLIRPAGAAYTQRFVERHRKMKMGIRDWEFLHPSLIPILGETHDVCAFQEDVTKICHLIAGLSYKKADRIRKMMNSSHEGAVETALWETTAREFIQGCMTHKGLTREQAVELWERVSSFTGFSFCKSHSASYAQLSFQCTYLKAYYPAQFLSAVVSNRHGFYTKDVYLNEARRWGIRILPMDINESEIGYKGKHRWIRPGLMHVRNLSEKHLESMVRERERNGPFRNLVDFIRRVGMHRKEIEKLILVGAFDGFGVSQPELLFLLDGVYGKLRPEQPGLVYPSSPGNGAFPGWSGGTREEYLSPDLTDYTLAERCLNELHLLGFMLSGNILDILDLHPASRNAMPAREIASHLGRRVKVFGSPVNERIHHVEHSGESMMFLTLEDKTEAVDVILWPDVYQRFGDEIAEAGPLEVWGRVTEDWDTFSVEATSIRNVDWSPGQVDFAVASKRLAKSFTVDYSYADIAAA